MNSWLHLNSLLLVKMCLLPYLLQSLWKFGQELTELTGVGETISALIVAEREANGPFYYAEDLESVRGIGPATLSRFREMIDLTQGEGRD